MITDDTQMTLFTAEGLLRSWVRACLRGIISYPGVTAHAYLRWLQTQGERCAADLSYGHDEPGWLLQQPAHCTAAARRATPVFPHCGLCDRWVNLQSTTAKAVAV
jgi:hypothetical protein